MNPNLENDTAGNTPDWPRQFTPGEEADVLHKLSAIKEPWNKKTKEETADYIADLISKIQFYENHAEAAKVLRDGATIVSVEEYTADRKQKADKLRTQVIEAMEAELAEFEADLEARQNEITRLVAEAEAERKDATVRLQAQIELERTASREEIEAERVAAVNEIRAERSAALDALVIERDELIRWIEEARAELESVKAEINAANTKLQEVLTHFDQVHHELVISYSGYNAFYNPASSAADLRGELEGAQKNARALLNTGAAVWVTGENSVKDMDDDTLREYGALVLNAYNQDIENAVLSMEKDRSIRSALERTSVSLTKANRLGEVFGISISDEYHALRTKEIEAAFALRSRHEVDQEQDLINREALREQEKRAKQIETRLVKIDEEREVLINQFDMLEAEQRLREEQGDLQDPYEGDPQGHPVARIRQRLQELKELEQRIRASITEMNAGYIYVASNVGAFGEQVVKISMTRSAEPETKIKSLNNKAVPFDYDVHTMFYSEKATAVKNALEEKFADREINKTNKYKEFFHASPVEVRDALIEIMQGNIPEFKLESSCTDFHRSLEAPLVEAS